MASVQQQANGNANGNGATVKPAKVQEEGAEENIFLFIPNLIGIGSSLTCNSSS